MSREYTCYVCNKVKETEKAGRLPGVCPECKAKAELKKPMEKAPAKKKAPNPIAKSKKGGGKHQDLKGFNPTERPEPNISIGAPILTVPEGIDVAAASAAIQRATESISIPEAGRKAPPDYMPPVEVPVESNGKVTLTEVREMLYHMKFGPENVAQISAAVWGYLYAKGLAT